MRSPSVRSTSFVVLALTLFAALIVATALASDNRSDSNAHRTDGIYHGIYTEHTQSGEFGWYFHAWTEHGHGGDKIVGIYHSNGSHIHCFRGPSNGGEDGHLHCSESGISTNHHSPHDAPTDQAIGQCRKYGDGHGICYHIHNGPFE